MSDSTPAGSTAVSVAHTGLVNGNRRKDELQAIAEAMGLSADGQRGALAERILAHMTAITATLSTNPQFAGLYSSLAAKKSSKSAAKPGGQKAPKKSSHKTAEDASEAAKTPDAATGANKKLQDLKVTTDPPPGFASLGATKKPDIAPTDKALSPLTDASSVEPDGDAKGPTDDPDDAHDKPEGKALQGETMAVLLNVLSLRDPPQEVYIPEVPVQTQALNGSIVHQTRLTQLLPAAIENHSPMKVKGGRFSRPGLHDPDAIMGAGTVAQHLNRDVPALKFDMADLYNLQPSKSGDFLTCSIMYDPDTEMTSKDAVVQPPGPTGLTGSGSDKPLEIARECARVKAENDPRNDEAKMREFHDFLLQHANVDLDNYSRGPVENMRDALIHHLEYTKVIDKFKPWLKTKKGYTVPTNSSQFPGYSFLKSDITSALGLKSSTTNGNSTLFKNKHLVLSKKAKEWVATEGKEHSLDFDGMAIAKWKARFLKTAKGGDDSDGHEAAKAAAKAQKKQKRQRANKSSSDEEEPVAVKKSKGKGKQRAVSDSEGMDDSD
ncbi:hypothetical protein C8J57DRAFT_1726079 [Mycena rebaudengoi]|nr:hypothetical protein C8J57DRAFT_1726079 [Mycena rebaudengoi]